LYQLNQNQLLWFSSKHPVQTINQLLALYANASAQGLVSSDYASQYLAAQWQNIQQSNPDYYQFAAFDTALSLTFLRYLY
jgi:murein L,D-transpeptidase YcbB/YkuD